MESIPSIDRQVPWSPDRKYLSRVIQPEEWQRPGKDMSSKSPRHRDLSLAQQRCTTPPKPMPVPSVPTEVMVKCPLTSQEPYEIYKQFFPCVFQGVSRSQGHFEDSHSDHSKPGTRRVQSLVKGKPQAESESGRDWQTQPCLAGEGQGLHFGKVPQGVL